jgi:phosphonate transport system substrate-binding protein
MNEMHKINKKLLFTISAALFFTISVFSCNRSEEAKVIDLEERKPLMERPEKSDHIPIRIAVGGMITPREGFAYYKQFLDYIEEKMGREVKFVDRENYAEINNLLRSNDIDVAFVCGGPYVDGHDEFGVELIAAPFAYGGTVYYSYIIVNADGGHRSFMDLKGKTFAFTDPLSNTGKLVPTYMLARMNETPESFFEKHVFTYAHDKSIKAVAQGLVDGAAVDSLIWEYANKKDPELTSKTLIVEKSPPYGIPPVVARISLDPEIKAELKKIFLDAHNDPAGTEILKGMMIDRFVEIDDSAYDSIRYMKRWVAQNRKM